MIQGVKVARVATNVFDERFQLLAQFDTTETRGKGRPEIDLLTCPEKWLTGSSVG